MRILTIRVIKYGVLAVILFNASSTSATLATWARVRVRANVADMADELNSTTQVLGLSLAFPNSLLKIFYILLLRENKAQRLVQCVPKYC